MLRRLIPLLQYVFFLGLGIVLIWWQWHSMTAEDKAIFFAALKKANYWLLLPVAAIALSSHLSRSLRWQLLLEPLHYKPSLKLLFTCTMIGYLVNSVLPRVGEIMKCTLVAKKDKVKVDQLIGTIIVERIFDLLCFIIFIGITLLIQIEFVGDIIWKELGRVNEQSDLPWGTKPILIVLFILLLYWGFKKLLRKFPQHFLIKKLQLFLHGIKEGAATIRQLKKRKAFLGHTLFIWLMYLLQIFVAFYAMPETASLHFATAFSVLSFASLSMIVTPGGIGSFPIFVMQILMMYGISSPVGRAFGWLMWGASTMIIILAGCVSLIVYPYLKNNKS